jgi:type I restriction enzyme S subunit
MKYKQYPSYKDSGVEWLGEIPESWGITKVKHLFSLGRGRVISLEEVSDSGKYPVYSSQTKDNGVLGLINTYDYDCRQITWTTDGANAGTVFLREGKHNCTNVCGTLQPKGNRVLLECFLYLLTFATQFYKRPDTNGAKIMNGEMSEIITSFPPIQEQKSIANYLDKATTKIDTLIEKQTKLIELLKEKRQAVISSAVTRGLDASVPMKDSGVEWLGEIPEHWDSTSLKRTARKITDGEHISPAFTDDGMPFLSAKDIRNRDINYEVEKFVTNQDGKKFRKRCNPELGDILIVSRGATIGRIGLVESDIIFCLLGSVILIKCDPKMITSMYAYFLLNQDLIKKQFILASQSSAQQAIYLTDISQLSISIPSLTEQQVIADYLNKATHKLDSLISKSTQGIDLLKEKRTALISGAVTGKIDVRDAA